MNEISVSEFLLGIVIFVSFIGFVVVMSCLIYKKN